MKKILRTALLAVLVFILALCAYVPIQQQILRHRAERLLADIKALQLRNSTWSDAQALMNRWDAWGQPKGDCVERECHYEIHLVDVLLRIDEQHPTLWKLWDKLRFPYSVLGGRFAHVTASITVLDGVLWEKSYGIDLSVSPKPFAKSNDEYGYELISVARTVSQFRFPSAQFFTDTETQLWSPAGCEGCSAIYFEFTPYADPQKVNQLMSFDLYCLTSLIGCRERSQLMPAAWKEMMTPIPEERWKRVENCELPLLVYSRQASNAAIVRVLTIPKIVEDGYLKMNVRLETPLKGITSSPPHPEREIEFSLRDIIGPTANPTKDFRPGMDIILLFFGSDLGPERCGIIPATQKNLAEVKLGIDRDYASKPRPRQLSLPN